MKRGSLRARSGHRRSGRDRLSCELHFRGETTPHHLSDPCGYLRNLRIAVVPVTNDKRYPQIAQITALIGAKAALVVVSTGECSYHQFDLT
jgi:hypothetical protein